MKEGILYRSDLRDTDDTAYELCKRYERGCFGDHSFIMVIFSLNGNELPVIKSKQTPHGDLNITREGKKGMLTVFCSAAPAPAP